MEKITIYGSFQDGGDGSVYMNYFLTENEVYQDQENQEEGCVETIETFKGSNVHKKCFGYVEDEEYILKVTCVEVGIKKDSIHKIKFKNKKEAEEITRIYDELQQD